ncbi:MAG: hypothetical protein JXR84_23415, partial [Anaerolineae bacterium]|nr:hypothetical protein [Anaerolineae bacterium]
QDLAKWDENFYTGQVGGPAILERVVQPGWLNDGSLLDYAFGLQVGPAHQHRGWQVVEHGGEHGGHCSWMVRFPELHMSVVVLFNHFMWEMRDYALKVADLFLEDKGGTVQETEVQPDQASVVVLSADQLQRNVGKYFNSERASLREVTYSGNRLQYQGLDLLPLSNTLFFFEVESQTHVEFIPQHGTVASMKTITSSGEYDYDRVETCTPTPDELTQYVGRYYSPELDITWTLIIEDDHLVAQRRKYVDSKLSPLFRDAFSDDWGPLMSYPTAYLVIFERDAHDAITGLRVSGACVRNLKFSKTE